MGRNISIYAVDSSDYLMHYGRKGMKWGQHIFTKDGRLKMMPGYSKTAKSVAQDYNRLSDKQFMQKYKTTKTRFAKRYAKGDPTKRFERIKNLSYASKDGPKWKGQNVRTKNGNLKVMPGASTVTRGVVKDHNSMTDDEFVRKYSVSKERYAKRYAKGDPARTSHRVFK